MKPTKQGDYFQLGTKTYTVDKFVYGIYDKHKKESNITFYNSLQDLIDADIPEFDGKNIYVTNVETGGLTSYNDIIYPKTN